MMNAERLCSIFIKYSDVITLPIRVDKGCGVYGQLSSRWEKYLQMLASIDDLSACIPYAKQSIDYLTKAIDAYYESEHMVALKHIIETINLLNSNPCGCHLISNLGAFYIDDEMKQWFRARVTDAHPLSVENIKHVPANYRKLINNERYSINGIPCLYIGNSILVCWEELNRPSIDSLWVSRYKPKKDLTLINLSTTGFELINAMKYLKYVNGSEAAFNQAIIEYFSNWILQSACSVVVEEEPRVFKEEYVIPQLVMQSIRNYKADGVMYFSTRMEGGFTDEVSWISKNIAIPASDVKGYGAEPQPYSPKIDSLFNISNPINVGMYANHLIPSGPRVFHESDNWARSHAPVFITRAGCPYNRTLFYKCEIELQHFYNSQRNEIL